MWLKADDKMHAHRKTRKVVASHPDKRRDAAPFGLWLMAGTWAGQNNPTTGWVPEFELDSWDDDWRTLANRLVKAGYWWPEVIDGEPGFGFVNWSEWNPAADAARSGSYGNHVRWHVKRGVVESGCEHCPAEPDMAPEPPGSSGGLAPDIAPESGGESDGNRETSLYPTRTRPDPTRPDPKAGTVETVENSGELVPTSPTPDGAPTKKGTRIPVNWTPTRNDANQKAEAGYDASWLELELARFRDYWAGVAGAKGTKLDWDATWRNWIRRANDFAPRKQATTMATAPWDQWMAEARAQDQAELEAS